MQLKYFQCDIFHWLFCKKKYEKNSGSKKLSIVWVMKIKYFSLAL